MTIIKENMIKNLTALVGYLEEELCALIKAATRTHDVVEFADLTEAILKTRKKLKKEKARLELTKELFEEMI